MIPLFGKLGLNHTVWIDQKYPGIRYAVYSVPRFVVQIANAEGIHMANIFVVKEGELNALIFLARFLITLRNRRLMLQH